MHLYVAAPMAGLPFGNKPAIKAAAQSLRKRGHDVTSPSEMNDADGEKGALEIGHPRRGEFLRRDLERIEQVDAVVVLPGWEDSSGALTEIAFARAIGKPVLKYTGLKPLGEQPGRHPASERFHAVLAEWGELHDVKQRDYGTDADPFANVRGTAEWGIPAWEGAMIRATDKVKRIMTFARRGTLSNEGVIDAFNDLGVYAAIARVLFEEGQPSQTGDA